MRDGLRRTFLFCFLMGMLLAIILPGTGSALAAEAEGNAKRVYDEAGILTQEEISLLEDMCLTYGEDAEVEIFILTHNDPNTVYPERYIEDFEDLLPVGDRVYFLYDMARSEIFMEGYGKAETYIHSRRIDVILDTVFDDMKAGNYYDAFETYITMSADYMKDDSELNWDHNYNLQDLPSGSSSDPAKDDYIRHQNEYDYDRYYDKPESVLTKVWFQLAASLAIGGITVGIMAYNSGGRMTAKGSDYLDVKRSGLIGRRDVYIRTRVTRIRRPTNNTNNTSGRGGFNSGGFRGGVSSGGRSHSSGGRRL